MIDDISRTEVAIVGSGPVGTAAAWALATRGVRVTMLEAGPEPEADRFKVMEQSMDGSKAWTSPLYPYEMRGDDIALNELTVRRVGGTTLTWGAVTPRFHPNDLRLRSRYGLGVDWPISYEELEPYYERAEELIGVAGNHDDPYAPKRRRPYPMPAFPMTESDRLVQRGAQRVGIQFHSVPVARNSTRYDGRPPCLYYGTCRACPIGALYSADQTINRLRRLPGFRLLTEAEVTRVEVDSRGAARRVVYLDSTGAERALTANAIVLAAQAVENVRILLNSACSSFPDGVANRNGQLGRWFMDRPKLYVMGKVRESLRPYRQGFETAMSSALHDHAKRDEHAGSRLLVRENAGPSPEDVAMRSGLWGEELREEIQALFGHFVTLGAAMEQLPHPDNRIRLSNRVKGRAGLPAARVDFRLTREYETAGAKAARKTMEGILSALGAEDIRLLMPPNGAGHYMGGHRMGLDPETSTVAPSLEAHEVPNLYLAGHGTYPTSGIANPTLTSIALSLRMADGIIKNNGNGSRSRLH